MADVTVPEGWLDYVPLAWHRVARYQRDDAGRFVRDPRTREPIFLGLSDQHRAHPVGWIDNDADGRVWVLG